jgi:zinc transport system ATP-binding protein
MAGREVVSLKNVRVSYNGSPALDDINLSVFEHDFLGVIGPNGGGKSTLLKVLLGLIKPERGTVTVLGSLPEQSRSKIGYVPQYSNYDRNFPVTVMDVVMMGRYGRTGFLRPYGKSGRQAAEKALGKVEMLGHAASQIGQLSGGQQQRTFIARALVAEPQLLLLDEPTASVDATMQTEFYKLLEQLKKEMTIIMVSHDIGAISVVVDKIACLNVNMFYNGTSEIDPATLEATYKCPVHMVAHGEVQHTGPKE